MACGQTVRDAAERGEEMKGGRANDSKQTTGRMRGVRWEWRKGRERKRRTEPRHKKGWGTLL